MPKTDSGGWDLDESELEVDLSTPEKFVARIVWEKTLELSRKGKWAGLEIGRRKIRR